jgi:hypothetical protein
MIREPDYLFVHDRFVIQSSNHKRSDNMGQAWPRFLPEVTEETTAHALIIEARTIIVEQLAEGQGDLIEAHERAMSYARARYSRDEIRIACNACATASGNENTMLHYLMTFSLPAVEDWREFDRVAA